MSTISPVDVRLEWQGPYAWRAGKWPPLAEAPESRQGGLYLWTVPTPSGYLVHYVGQTERGFAARHFQHLQAYLTGSYSIHNPEKFREGRREQIYRGYGYRSGWTPVFDFAECAGSLLPHIVAMLDSMALFLAPLTLATRSQRLIEAAIIQLLYSSADEQVRNFQSENMRCWRRVPADPAIVVECVTSAVVLRGVPSRFEA